MMIIIIMILTVKSDKKKLKFVFSFELLVHGYSFIFFFQLTVIFFPFWNFECCATLLCASEPILVTKRFGCW